MEEQVKCWILAPWPLLLKSILLLGQTQHICSWAQGNLKGPGKTRTAMSEGTSVTYPAQDTRAVPLLSFVVPADFCNCKEEQLGLLLVLLSVLALFSWCRAGKGSSMCQVLDSRDTWCNLLGATLTGTGEWNWIFLQLCAKLLLKISGIGGHEENPRKMLGRQGGICHKIAPSSGLCLNKVYQRGGEREMMWWRMPHGLTL